jgi:hypothetical protein
MNFKIPLPEQRSKDRYSKKAESNWQKIENSLRNKCRRKEEPLNKRFLLKIKSLQEKKDT